ncbi:MAG: hypothetical protein JWQ81_6560 [Amycolatopsis sp.]|nr:hypothetical protein [Amycolatopsis sp.]
MGDGGLDAVGHLLGKAADVSLRAPELSLILGERAAALAEAAGSDQLWVRAESLVVSASVRLGDRPATVGRAVAALRAAEDAGYADIAARLRIDLAVCARAVGAPLTALAALRPVLAEPHLSPVQRAEALCHLVGCLAQFGRKAELDRVLLEADRLCSTDESLDADTVLLLRALLRVGTSAHRRRHGDLTAAADAARTGLGLLERLDRPEDAAGLVRIRLVLQLACTLLDRGDTEMALEISEPVLAAPLRAASIAPAGWLRLAIATRVHLPAGSGEAATVLLREAVYSTDQHGLHALTARLWLELAQLEERLGRPSEAIECLHRSRAAEHLHSRERRQACGLLSGEFGSGEQAQVDLDDILSPTTSRSAVSPAAPAVPELQLAPAPAAEPAPRVPQVTVSHVPLAVPESFAPSWELPEPPRNGSSNGRSAHVSPASATSQTSPTSPTNTASPTNGRATESRSPAVPEPVNGHRDALAPTTRHDSEHGSVAARSVLDRLGIAGANTGGGGGRRRATDDVSSVLPPEPARATPVPTPEPVAVFEPEPPAPAPVVTEPTPEPFRRPAPSNDELSIGDRYGDQVSDPWLPRLRMPPSLEPLQDSGGSQWSSTSEPFGDGYARAISADEPPPDAGLAELLARALAEHQAGTSSASALVKRLGPQTERQAERQDVRPMNGHRRSGETAADSGRHRTDES